MDTASLNSSGQSNQPKENVKKPVKRQKAKYHISCGAVIFRFDKGVPYYFLLRSAQTKSNYWGFVRGGVEPGETEEQTVNREAAEEAGIYDLKVVPRFRETQHYFYRFEGKLIRKDAIYLLAKTYDWKTKISHEHLDCKWATYEEALEIMKLRPLRELLTKAHIHIQNNLEGLRLF
jgi:bis(5'-nucleosidyl)-tetraphosphatase